MQTYSRTCKAALSSNRVALLINHKTISCLSPRFFRPHYTKMMRMKCLALANRTTLSYSLTISKIVSMIYLVRMFHSNQQKKSRNRHSRQWVMKWTVFLKPQNHSKIVEWRSHLWPAVKGSRMALRQCSQTKTTTLMFPHSLKTLISWYSLQMWIMK